MERLSEHIDTIKKAIGKGSGASLLPDLGALGAAVEAASAAATGKSMATGKRRLKRKVACPSAAAGKRVATGKKGRKRKLAMVADVGEAVRYCLPFLKSNSDNITPPGLLEPYPHHDFIILFYIHIPHLVTTKYDVTTRCTYSSRNSSSVMRLL